jgi:DNA-binding SARP family transcriptional activator
MGRVVRPHLQSAEMARDVEDVVAPASAPEAERIEGAAMSGRGSEIPRREMLVPGPVDVRVLTITPRLDGLREELPPNRARRAVELVAYLALHHPDVITSDRLRTRVLGSSDADAAAKTLFNTAYAARRALGVDEQGELLFPAGTRNGLYQVSSKVTVDVQRAIALASEGKAQDDADLAIAYFRAALDLVEGEPLANALSGYSWWEAEGHGGRIAAVLVDAACTMAALACDAGNFELARWGLERARMVEPYSEALSRAAMQLAAAEGDADRLRLEWRECQRRVDALDPGSSPSPRTESLYGELKRRVLVAATVPVAPRSRYPSTTND